MPARGRCLLTTVAVPAGYFEAVIQGLGLPVDSWRLEFFTHWQPFENTTAKFNPLATTQHMPGSTPLGGDPNQNNGNPVQEYLTFADGVAATVKTLQNGDYPAIIAALWTEKIVNRAELVADIRTWGTSGFADAVNAGWTPTSAVVTSSTSDDHIRLQRLERLIGGNGITDKNGATLVGDAALTYADNQGWSALLGIEIANQRIAVLGANLQKAPGLSPEVIAALKALVAAAENAG